MRRLNIPLIADALFTGLCAFLLFFTAVRYYTKSPVWGLAFGVAAALLFGALAFLYIGKRQKKSLLLSRDEREKRLLALHLSLSSDGYIKKLFLSALGDGAKVSGKKIVKDGCANFFIFGMQPLSGDDAARVIKYDFDGGKKIYCNHLSPEAESLAAHFSIETETIDGVYSLLKEKRLLPQKYAYEEGAKPKLAKRIKSRFNRRISPPLFWSGAGLLALSYFTFYPIYYIITGSILIFLAALSFVINQS